MEQPHGTPPTAAPTFAVILAGGGGTRLWPSSRRKRPKQLLALAGPETLLGAAARRARVVAGNAGTLVVTAADQAEQVRNALPELPPENVIVEPEPRNTAAAVGLAAAVACRRGGPDAVLAIFPADPHIGDEHAFLRTVKVALAHARDAIVTIGLQPRHPETGFGYIKMSGPVTGVEGPLGPVRGVDRFVEKPDLAHAQAYVASGQYLWNSGMFFLTAGRMLQEARAHLPALGEALDAFVAAPDLNDVVAARYGGVPSISIDHGIMEKAAGLRVVPGDFGWNDVGSWAALPAIREPDIVGNVVVGDAVVEDTRGSVIVAEAGAPLVGVVGAHDLIVVATRDAVLVIPKDRAQDVRRIVDALKTSGRNELL